MTDMVIPPEAIRAAAFAYLDARHPVATANGNRVRPETHDVGITAALEAALPHLRPMFELAGNLGRELGRREMAEEIAAACEKHEDDARRAEAQTHDPVWFNIATGYMRSAELAREVATNEPEARRTRCSHCGFYRPSLLNHHPGCPHAATKEPK